MSLCRSALRGLSEERRTHKKRAVTKELDNCRRCGQASHRNLSNALNDIDSTTWLAKRMHSDDCGAAVGKHALVVFTGTADFKCDLVSQKAPIYRGVATSVSDLQRCQRGLLTRACTSDLCLEQRSVGEGRRATAACIGWSAPWWSAPWCLRRGVCAVVAACIGWSAYWMVTRTQGQCMNNAYGLCGGAVTPKSIVRSGRLW